MGDPAVNRGRLTYQPGGAVEYTRPDGWTVRAEVGWDEARSAEVLDLRKVGKWYPGADPLGLRHDPNERRDVTTPDLLEIDDVFTRNYAARRRPLLIIQRDASETLREPPPEAPLIVSTEPAAAPRRKARKPERGLLGNKAGMSMIAISVMSLASYIGNNLLQRTYTLHMVGLVVLCGGVLVMGGIAAMMLYESRRFSTRRRKNQCIECGYSRESLKPEDACPECGAGHWYG